MRRPFGLFVVACALTLLAAAGVTVDRLAELVLAPIGRWVDDHQVLTVVLLLAVVLVLLAAWTVAPALRREAVNRPHPARGRRSRLSSGGRRARLVSGTRARPPL